MWSGNVSQKRLIFITVHIILFTDLTLERPPRVVSGTPGARRYQRLHRKHVVGSNAEFSVDACELILVDSTGIDQHKYLGIKLRLWIQRVFSSVQFCRGGMFSLGSFSVLDLMPWISGRSHSEFH